MAVRTIEVRERLMARNDELASVVRDRLRAAGVTAFNLVSSPGSGKTSLLERTLDALGEERVDSAEPGWAAAVLATRVKSCRFVYDPNQGATQQSGFVWMQLELARAGETAHMAVGAHVANGP